MVFIGGMQIKSPKLTFITGQIGMPGCWHRESTVENGYVLYIGLAGRLSQQG